MMMDVLVVKYKSFQVLKEEMNFRKKPLDKFKIFTKYSKRVYRKR